MLVSVCQAFPLVGWIQSPGFPQGYGSNVSKTWRRCAPPGHFLSLTLLHLDLETSYQCENDALKVKDRTQLTPYFLPTPLLLSFLVFMLCVFRILISLLFSLFQIFEGSNVLADLCGRMTLKDLQSSVNPSLRSSSGGCLSLTFRSDFSNTHRHTGFNAFYTTKGKTARMCSGLDVCACFSKMSDILLKSECSC